MYTTRPLSIYRENPGELLVPPPLVPNSGYLVIKDEFPGSDDDACCWDACPKVRKLPFPQNMTLSVIHRSNEGPPYELWFIPVLDQPLSFNRYYVIIANGSHKGQAYRCPTERDVQNSCFGSYVQDVEPKPFDHRDLCHQVEIRIDNYGRFYAKSIAPDGFPPGPLRSEGGWRPSYAGFVPELIDAQGLNSSLRGRLPNFNFPISNKRSDHVTVGKWYSPFIFLREEGSSPRSQMKKSMFYEITLEQYWEEICTLNNDGSDGNSVTVDANVQREASFVVGEEAVKDDDDGNGGDGGFIWFKSLKQENGRKRVSVGLSLAIVEAMKWVQEEGGWVNGDERSERIERVEENENEGGGWRKFGCYVLVESFVFKRMDKSLVLNCDFKHAHQTKSKWQ